MSVRNLSSRGKMRVPCLIFVFLACDWISGARAITNGNKSESKLKREDGPRSYNDYHYDVKPFLTSKGGDSRDSRYKQPLEERTTKDQVHLKDNVASGSGNNDRSFYYGFYPPAQDSAAGYGYQDIDQNSHYGPPVPDRGEGSGEGGYHQSYDGHQQSYEGHQQSYGGHQQSYDGHHQSHNNHHQSYGDHHQPHNNHQQPYDDHRDHYYDHREHAPQHHGYAKPHYGPDPHALALKGLLLPLAGVALLGVAASLVTNPVLLQLGVVSGRKRRSIAQDIFKADQTSTTEAGKLEDEHIQILKFNRTIEAQSKEFKLKEDSLDKLINESKNNDTSKYEVKLQFKKYNNSDKETKKLLYIKNTSITPSKSSITGRHKRSTDELEVTENSRTETSPGGGLVKLITPFNSDQNNSPINKKPVSADIMNDSTLATDDYDDVKHDGKNIYSFKIKRPKVL